MSTRLLHPPNAILARVLVANLALGTDPAWWANKQPDKMTEADWTEAATTTRAWPVFNGSEPSFPDECLTVYETAPEARARIALTGETIEGLGLVVRVRGLTEARCRVKAEDVRWNLNVNGFDQRVTLTSPTQDYLLVCVSRTNLIPFGRSQPNNDLWLCNVNLTCSLRAYPLAGAT